MDPLTLTGATFVERKHENCTLNHDHSTSHHHHHHDDHNGQHQHNHKDHNNHVSQSSSNHESCPLHAQKKVPQVRVVYTPPSREELQQASPDAIRLSLETLVRLGAYQDAFEPLLTLILEARPDALNSVLNSLGNDHYSLIHWAAKRSDDVRFLQLLCSKVSLDTINIPSTDKVAMRPLHWAASEGSIPHAATLLRHGANIEGTDGAGCTALLLAAQYGHVDMVAFLLQRGANGRAVDQNRDSALHWAAYKGSIQVCGHLLYRKELNWMTTDAYGQTPIHLAAIRGNTEVIRYLLHQGTEQDVKFVLNLPDKNGKTPLDLAIKKQKPTVELVLRETMEKHDKWGKRTRSILVQLFSYHSWKIWMGCSTSHDVDVSPKFPLYFMVTHMILYSLWYPFVFTPIFNTSTGVLWDLSMFHASNILAIILFWYFQNKTRTTDPGCLDDANPETSKYRKKYEEAIELLSDESTLVHADVSQLCHTCHLWKPLRSKHCRDARRCVLLFDHHCPFVGATIGLYNYPWFYLTLLSMTWCCITFVITLTVYLRREFSWFLCIFGIYLSSFVLFSGGMLVYHTQLSCLNLTTNEHINMARYKYLKGDRGEFRNPFDRGWLSNFINRFHPSPAAYTIESHFQPLIRGDNVV